MGDRQLAKVSKRLDSVITDNEQCGRLGGDEFAVVIRDATDKGRVDRLADAIIDTLFAALHDRQSYAVYWRQRRLRSRSA